ncbi:hypothetical protein G647_09923 [Cladophialophora carrionii CBS 160.54]|uniref:Uncharacterized protein n=1 Tax=Cladophialophora carrionii CBS 160.54 TaxID=1279043 RepID=V9DK50_9EURO|nr:uncharacterized protein G647_09923 [Cladophialophora carrionii CBS 160.54]ETI27240.1 hypothetical protein G647_09923 [Cladophialophora carrionii CBS 160.54]
MSTIIRLNGDSSAMSMIVRPNCQKFSRTPFQAPSLEISMKKQRTSQSVTQVQDAMQHSVLKEDSDCHQSQPPFLVNTARRVTNALTAREIYESALDPALVPEPLTLRGQYRNVSAPAALQTTRSDSPRYTPLQQVATGDGSSKRHFHSRRRSHQHVLLDISARLIAAGIEAADVAQIMNLILQELIHKIARCTVAVRDTPSIVEEEIRTFYASNSASSDGGFPQSGGISPHVTDADVTHRRGDPFQEERTTHHHQSDAVEEGPWARIKEMATPHDFAVDGHQQDEGLSVYHDALESLEKEPAMYQQLIQQGEHDTSTCCRRPAGLGFWRRNAPAALPVQTTPASESIALVPSPLTAQPSRMATFLMGIRTAIFASLATIVGRLLGVLMSELQTSGFSLINILNTLGGCARMIALVLAMVLCVQIYARTRS